MPHQTFIPNWRKQILGNEIRAKEQKREQIYIYILIFVVGYFIGMLLAQVSNLLMINEVYYNYFISL